MLDSIAALEKDANTEVIVVISKPPAKAVRDKVLAALRNVTKPVVTIFLGEKPTYHEENLYHAYTLEETARIAVDLLNHQPIEVMSDEIEIPTVHLQDSQKHIKGYYSGGTLASETAMLIADAMKLEDGLIKKDGFVLKTDGNEVIDLGDDMYTQGKPHPMIDPEKRIEMIQQAADDETTAIILLDVVLGYGAHDDMATALAPTIKETIAKAQAKGRELIVIGTVVGTTSDPQNFFHQKQLLEEAGVLVCDSNNQAVRTALGILGLKINDSHKEIKTIEKETTSEENTPSERVLDMLSEKPYVINLGLKSFSDAIRETGGKALQFNWKPVAGGDLKLQKVLYFLNHYHA